MTEYDLGNIEEIDGFDKYINKELKEKEKDMAKLKLEIRRLYMIIQLQDDIIESYRELARINRGKVVIE